MALLRLHRDSFKWEESKSRQTGLHTVFLWEVEEMPWSWIGISSLVSLSLILLYITPWEPYGEWNENLDDESLERNDKIPPKLLLLTQCRKLNPNSFSWRWWWKESVQNHCLFNSSYDENECSHDDDDSDDETRHHIVIKSCHQKHRYLDDGFNNNLSFILRQRYRHDLSLLVILEIVLVL